MNKSDIALVVYPNVFDTELKIDAEAQLKNYAIYGIYGKVILEGPLNGG